MSRYDRTEEGIPKQWRQGLIIIVSMPRKGDAEDPSNNRGITLLNEIGKLFCKILLGNKIRIRKALHEGQAGFRCLLRKHLTQF